MRFSIFCFLILVFVKSYSQEVPFDKILKESQVRLKKNWKAKKIVAYKINSVTVLLDYKDCKKEYKFMRKRYSQTMKDIKKDIKNGEYVPPEMIRRCVVVDSIYRLMKTQIKLSDTIYLTHSTFSDVGLLCLMDIDKQIDRGTCGIIDENNLRRFTVIRKKGSVYRGPLEAWGGRRYYLQNQEKYFYQVTDWIS